MRTPAEYVDLAMNQDAEAAPLSAFDWEVVAELAVALALADAEKYKTNLVGAVLRSIPPPHESH